MSVFRSIVFSAVVSGAIVGGVVTLAQQFGTVPLILQGEVYEKAAEETAAKSVDPAPAAQQHAGHQHDDHHASEAAWEPKDGLERNSYTAAANILTAIGFAMLLGGIYALRGANVSWHEGLLWGLSGFVVFTVAPGLGLPPGLPGVPAAALEMRQIWWIATAATTAAGLYLIFFKRSPWAAVIALGLIAAPHLIGAPRLDDFHTNVPEALSRQFIVAVTLTSLLFWALLGSLTSITYRRFAAS
ncbi:MAG TPA: CbtA family protein [Xanthobacteraceae bacterium]|jgi:cobalt transporter subunit CbtA|nr:CbtA family protein [Xanthobacteraceae bacterium]